MHHVITGHNGCKALRQLEAIESEKSAAGARGCGHPLAYAITFQMIKELNDTGGRSNVECGLPKNLILSLPVLSYLDLREIVAQEMSQNVFAFPALEDEVELSV